MSATQSTVHWPELICKLITGSRQGKHRNLQHFENGAHPLQNEVLSVKFNNECSFVCCMVFFVLFHFFLIIHFYCVLFFKQEY